MPTPAPTSVPGEVEARNLIEHTQPLYPPVAKAARVSGDVVLRALIDTAGAVKSLQFLSGPEMLRAAAEDAVARWRYKPYLVDGKPVEVETTVTVHFDFGPRIRDRHYYSEFLPAIPLVISTGGRALRP